MRHLSLFLFVLAFTFQPVFAHESWEKDPVYLEKTALPIKTAIAPPPKAASAEDQKDMQALVAAQAHRSEQDCKRAESEVNVTLESFFGPPWGPLTTNEAQKWSPFFEKIRTDAEYFAREVKSQWSRPRPFVENLKLNPCVRREKSNSYPSGHATISRVFSRVLSMMDPKRKGLFEKRANQIGEDRVLAGVHHPSDIEAGTKLGDQVFLALMKNSAFTKELASQTAK